MLKVEDLIHTPLLFLMFWQEKCVHKILSQVQWVIHFITPSSRPPRKLDWRRQWGSEWLPDVLGSAPRNLDTDWETRTKGAEATLTLGICWGMVCRWGGCWEAQWSSQFRGTGWLKTETKSESYAMLPFPTRAPFVAVAFTQYTDSDSQEKITSHTKRCMVWKDIAIIKSRLRHGLKFGIVRPGT